MSSMPDNGATGDQGRTQQTARPDVPAQGAAPPDQATQQQPPPGQPMQQGRQPMAPPPPRYGQARRPMIVTEAETRVTGRRIVQYIVDYFLAGIIPAIAYWVFDNEVNGIRGLGWLVATVIAAAAYFAYWVLYPYSHGGQTFGMQLFRLRVISKNGGKASMMQLFIRGIFLILDTLFFGLVGLITILASRYRQRIGDHAAGTVVVPVRYGQGI
ncbi:MAG TPA: RDD family protein [Streptosporangiaceae bacterium]|nr:RDD family protein [Streptosporangiaceae bacterium]